jgi:hypothetical protein
MESDNISAECFMCPVYSFTLGVRGHCEGCKHSVEAKKFGVDQAANLRKMVANNE